MAASKGGDDGRSLAEIDNEAIERFNQKLKLSMDREARLIRHHEWRGNKLPPFNIQPLPHVRQRLDGGWMSEEDRQLRKQWLKDQHLTEHEPRYIPELYPKNPFRRMLAAPFDALFNVLKPVVGERGANHVRFWVPKAIVSALVIYGTYYHLKFSPSTWADKHGWNIYSNKPVMVHGEFPPAKSESDYYDRGFKNRTVLLGQAALDIDETDKHVAKKYGRH